MNFLKFRRNVLNQIKILNNSIRIANFILSDEYDLIERDDELTIHIAHCELKRAKLIQSIQDLCPHKTTWVRAYMRKRVCKMCGLVEQNGVFHILRRPDSLSSREEFYKTISDIVGCFSN